MDSVAIVSCDVWQAIGERIAAQRQRVGAERTSYIPGARCGATRWCKMHILDASLSDDFQQQVQGIGISKIAIKLLAKRGVLVTMPINANGYEASLA